MGRHDQLFKDLIRTFFADFLELIAAQAVQRLDLSCPVFLDKETFTDFPRGERREMDLIAKMPRRDDPEKSGLVHVEIEREARPGIGPRIWSYARQLILRHSLPVLSLVVFRRGGPAGIVWQTLREDQLGPELETFTFCTWGLSRSRAEDYLTRPQPPAWAFAALMRTTTLTRPQQKLACLRRIAQAPQLDDAQRYLLANFVETYLQLGSEDAMTYATLISKEVWNGEVDEADMTWGDRLQAKFMVEYLEDFRQFLLLQLTQRFGPLPETARPRLQAIQSMRDLKRLGEQILIASSLADLGLA